MAIIIKRIGDLIDPNNEFKHLNIREIDQEIDDQTNEVISEKYHRRVIMCGDNVSNEDETIQYIAGKLWTQEARDKYSNFLNSQN